MATKEQFDFFYSQYKEEDDRKNALTKKAEMYFSIISVFFGAIILKVKDIFDLISNCRILQILFVVTSLIFAIILILIINSIRISSYERATDLLGYVENLKASVPSNEDFFDDRIIDFIAATEDNRKVNDAKAKSLSRVRIVILFAVMLLISFTILTMFKTKICI